jgi:hypothetical protein
MLNFINPEKQIGDTKKPSVSIYDSAEILALFLARADVASGILVESAKFDKNSNDVVIFKTEGFNVNTGAKTADQNLFLTVGNVTLTYDTTSKNIYLKSNSPAIYRVNHMWSDINHRKPMEIATVSAVDNPEVKVGDFVVLAESANARPYAFGIVENVTSSVMNVLILIETFTKYTYGGVLQFDMRQYFPAVGEKDFIYVALDTTWAYYWNGTAYVTINPYKLPANLVKEIQYQVNNNTLMLDISLVDPVTGDITSTKYYFSGPQLVFTQTDNNVVINLQIIHDNTLLGTGTEDYPISVNPDSTTINHGISMKGSGTATDPIFVDIEVDGSPNYGMVVYTGKDNQQEVQMGAPVSSLPVLVSSTEFMPVILRSRATISNPIPYTPPTLDGIMMFNLPSDNVAQYMRIIFTQDGCWLYDVIATSKTPPTRALAYQLADANFWKPDWQHNCVLKFYSITSDYQDTWKFIDQGIYADVFKFNSLNKHIADNERHLNTDERSDWNATSVVLAGHVSNTTVHVQPEDRTYWNGKVNGEALQQETTERKATDADLSAAIQALQQLGRYLNTVESYNAAAPRLVDVTTDDIPASAKPGDYISVRHDETHDGGVNIWRIQSIDWTTKQITWVWDYSTGSDTGSFMPKIGEQIYVPGHIPTMGGGTGELAGTPIDPTTFATDTELSTHENNATIHVTALERTGWNAKADQTALQTEIDNRITQGTNLGTRIDDVIKTIKGRYLGQCTYESELPTVLAGAVIGDFMLVQRGGITGNACLYKILDINASSKQISWTKDFEWPNTAVEQYLFKRKLKLRANYSGSQTPNWTNVQNDEWCSLVFQEENAAMRILASNANTSKAIQHYFICNEAQRVIYMNVAHYFDYASRTSEDSYHAGGVSHDSSRWVRNFGSANSPLATWMQLNDTYGIPMAINERNEFFMVFPKYNSVYNILISDASQEAVTSGYLYPFIEVRKSHVLTYDTVDQANRFIYI